MTSLIVAPCKEVRLVESGIREIPASGIRILGFEIQNTAQGIRYPSNLTIGIWHPSSTDKESDIEYLESRIHGVESRTVLDSL